jgi:DNA-binding PadR family transcriptional regulator
LTILNRKIYRGPILESIFLNLINDSSDRGVHGYAIFKAVHKKFGIRLAPSTLYPELKNLEKQGLIVSSWDFSVGKARRQYRITRKGQTELREYFVELRALIPSVVTCKT